jgi:hypothetical protein
MLRPGGTVLLNRNALVPAAVDPADYPSIDAIRGVLADHETIEFDALGESRAMGDEQGRFSNVIALGLLSTVEPFSRVPLATWRDALFAVSPSDFVRRANLASFLRGRGASLPVGVATMGDADDEHGESLVDRLVDDPVGADAQPAETGELALQQPSCVRLLREPVDGGHQASPIVRVDPA